MVANSEARTKIALLGAGSWGTTLAWLLGSNKRQVSVWSRDTARLERLRDLREVERPVNVRIPDSVNVCSKLEECLSGADLIVFACSAQSMRIVARQVAQALSAPVGAGRGNSTQSRKDEGMNWRSRPILVSAAKGIELKTFKRMTEVLNDVLPGYAACALSGPNLAVEVLRGLPTASVVACADEEVARFAQLQLSVPAFRVYTNTDVVGVELGGALKNIIAIAAGAVDGFELGINAKAALMTRGLAEMVRLATLKGARATTLSGLAGMGDLVATCYSSLSRNYRLGYHLACGEPLEKIQQDLGAVAEGVTTAHAVCELSQHLDIQMPIAGQVAATLGGLTTPQKAIMSLMTRPLASE